MTPEVRQFEQIANDEYKAVIDKLREGMKERKENTPSAIIEGMRQILSSRKDNQTEVKPGVFTFAMPEQPAPSVNVTMDTEELAKKITDGMASVIRSMPQPKAPIVNVPAPIVNVTDNKPNETDEVIKAIRKLNK